MRWFLDKILVVALFLIKILASILMAIFPQIPMEIFYPFCFFSPLLLAAVAYADISKWLLLVFLIMFAVFILCLVLFPFLLFSKKHNGKFLATALQVFFLIESVCFLLSLLFGTFSFGKMAGIVFNCVIAILLNKIKHYQETECNE